MYTLDTNAVLYYLGGDNTVRAMIDKALREFLPLYVSPIAIAELLRFPKLTNAEESSIKTFISICAVINIDAIVADRAGALGRLHNLKLADSFIAATALYTGTTLLTRNVRDFRRVPELIVEPI